MASTFTHAGEPPAPLIFEGYASVFNLLDHDGDIILPGAFQKTLAEWRTRGEKVPLLWQHQSDLILGYGETLREDNTGLWVKGHIHTTSSLGQLVAQELRTKRVSHLSIGFFPLESSESLATKTRFLHTIDLREISLVTRAANSQASVSWTFQTP